MTTGYISGHICPECFRWVVGGEAHICEAVQEVAPRGMTVATLDDVVAELRAIRALLEQKAAGSERASWRGDDT